MYNKVVVPLDGSKLAEVVLPHLEEIAKGCSIPEVMLVSVTERLSGRVMRQTAVSEMPPREFHPPQPGGPLPMGSTHTGLVLSSDFSNMSQLPTDMGKMAKTAWNYLGKIADQLRDKGLFAQAYVLVGNPAEEILSFADEKGADLIVMATRGKSGFNRWDMGNVADKVMRATSLPIVLVKPKADFKETKAKRRGKPN